MLKDLWAQNYQQRTSCTVQNKIYPSYFLLQIIYEGSSYSGVFFHHIIYLRCGRWLRQKTKTCFSRVTHSTKKVNFSVLSFCSCCHQHLQEPRCSGGRRIHQNLWLKWFQVPKLYRKIRTTKSPALRFHLIQEHEPHLQRLCPHCSGPGFPFPVITPAVIVVANWKTGSWSCM